MENVLLIDLPKRKDLIGKRINVISQGGKYHYDYEDIPMMRVFTGAKIKKENGKKWIFWMWVPEATEGGGCDCGYSGIMIESVDFGDSYLSI